MQDRRSPELVKLYYRIGEVAKIIGVQPHVLRYWETEFRSIRPQKSSKGQRVYSRKDVERLLHVKDLLKNQGFTIAGARRQLRQASQAKPAPVSKSAVAVTEVADPSKRAAVIRPSTTARLTSRESSVHDATSGRELASGSADQLQPSASLAAGAAVRHAALALQPSSRPPSDGLSAGGLGAAKNMVGRASAATGFDPFGSASESPGAPIPDPRLSAPHGHAGLPPQNAKALRRALVQVRAEVVSLLREMQRP